MSTPQDTNIPPQQASFGYQDDDEADTDEYTEIFAHLRAADETKARNGDIKGLWTTADSTVSHLSSRFVTEPSVDFSGGWALQLQNLWHLYYVAGKHCSEAVVAPLILQVVETAQRGVLSRTRVNSSGGLEMEHAPATVAVGGRTVQQLIWCDMPFLVPNMTDYWVRDCGGMSRSQRVRVSFFVASLVGASTAQWADGLCSISLILLRDALETDRRLVRAAVEPGGEDSENSGRTMDMLTIADLLLSVNTWFVRAGARMAQLCEMGDEDDSGMMPRTERRLPVPPMVSRLGHLAAEAGVRQVEGGFSSERWFFWLRRLEAIGTETVDTSPTIGMAPFVQKVKAEKQLARQVAYNMVYVASQSDSRIVRELMRVGRLPLSL